MDRLHQGPVVFPGTTLSPENPDSLSGCDEAWARFTRANESSGVTCELGQVARCRRSVHRRARRLDGMERAGAGATPRPVRGGGACEATARRRPPGREAAPV